MFDDVNERIRTLLNLHDVYNVPEEAIYVLRYLISNYEKSFNRFECSQTLGISPEFVDMALSLFLQMNILKGEGYDLTFSDNIFLALK